MTFLRWKMRRQRLLAWIAVFFLFIVSLASIRCASTGEKKPALPKEKDPQYQYELALTAMRYGLREEALKYLNRAVSLDPNHYPSFFLLGAIQAQMKNFEEAEAAFRRCLEIKPDSGEAHLRLGYVYVELHQLDRAEEELKKAAAGNGHVEALISLAKLYYEQNKLEQALETISRVTQKDRRSFPAFNLQGVVLNELGRYAEAIASFQNALQIAPENDVASINLAAAYINNGNLKEAQDLLEKTLTRVKDPTLRQRVLEYLEKIKELKSGYLTVPALSLSMIF